VSSVKEGYQKSARPFWTPPMLIIFMLFLCFILCYNKSHLWV
jgi:tryptophan-rich sensory protein